MTIKIKKVIGQTPIQTKDGRSLTKYQILTDKDEVLDTFSEVKEGQEYEGEITENAYGKQFKKAKQGFNGGSKSDPATQKAIIRQNALTNAVNYCVAKAQLDKNYKLEGKEVIQVATYFAKYSMGEISVVTETKKPEVITGDKEDFIAQAEKAKEEFLGEGDIDELTKALEEDL